MTDEFNRIVATSEFNSTKLFSLNQTTVNLQGGYGANGAIGFSIGAELDQNIGNGTLNTTLSMPIGAGPRAVVTGDFNMDGHADIIGIDDGSDALTVRLGNGNGTFAVGSAVNSVASNSTDLVTADFNYDGFDDLVYANNAGTTNILLGNGNGTFKSGTAVIASAHDLFTGDFNGDGKIDIVGTNAANDAFIQFGNGNGTFTAMTTVLTGLAGAVLDTFGGDFNMDGYMDLEFARSGSISYVFGNGNGTFRAGTSLSVNVGNPNAMAADFNRDGYLDLVAGDNGQNFAIFMNNGDGTFKARATIFSGGGLSLFTTADFNGDGLQDMVSYDPVANCYFHAGNGDGTFKAKQIVFIGAAMGTSVVYADFNEDGAPDIAGVSSGVGAINASLQQTTVSTNMDSFDLTTQKNARDAMTMLSATLKRVNSEEGSVGAYQSRISSGSAVLSQLNESYITARSQIVDADVAFETAQLVRNKILQQAGSAVLAQANQAPAIALSLLQSGTSK